MPKYKGQYPYFEKGLKPGTLETSQVLSHRLLVGDWNAIFHFDEKAVPGRVDMGINADFKTEKEAYADAVKKGFILTTKEGE